MPKSDTWRLTGYESEMSHIAISPAMVQITGATPVLYPSASTGVDTSTRGRKSILILVRGVRTGGKETVTVTESATTNGTFTASTMGSTVAQMEATGLLAFTIKPNKAKPFLRVTFTGDGAPADWIVSASLLYI